jgi:hypothetical protein
VRSAREKFFIKEEAFPARDNAFSPRIAAENLEASTSSHSRRQRIGKRGAIE